MLGLAGIVPVGVLACAIALHRWKAKQRGTRLPTTEKLLRPPGYSLSRRLENLWENFTFWMFGAYVASLCSVGTWKFTPNDITGEMMFFGVFGIAAAACTVCAWRSWLGMRRTRLGLLGEQAVAEQLQVLGLKGYQVFHDIPGDGKWNVDHVLVGPAGVFVIETKARVKQPGRAGGADFHVGFDGKVLRFPGGQDRKAAQQARANAKWVAAMLSKATGETVRTVPIVALPGWMVDRARPDFEVQVLNSKEVPVFIADAETKLSGKQVQQIAYQLDQRCRDMAF
jgi:hypothetical protein